VVGEIRARRIVVEGAIKGNLYALESVTLRSGAAVHGDVFAPRIVVEEGARLTGRIDMENAPAVPRVSLPASGASESATGDLSDQQAAVLLSGS
jgi:cytoskeletal protein CcmA (bactofilin family)